MLNLQSIYFGQHHANFDSQDYNLIRKVSRLAKKHERLCEMACNGEGYIKGSFYYTGAIDDYAKQTYGVNVKSAYLDEETTVFQLEADKIEEKIIALTDKTNFKVEFQHDPRGNTVKLYYESDFIEL